MILKRSKKTRNKQHKHALNNDNQNEATKEVTPQYSNIPINISRTRFPIIEECCNELDYKIVDSNSKALIFWCDAGGSFEFTSSLSHFQFCNHFPGTWSLARKVDLARNIGRLNKILPNLYNFHPKSFMIPSQYSELESFMNEKKNQKEKNRANKNLISSKNEIDNNKSKENDQKITFIVKPDKGSFGRGIFLIQDPSEISGYYTTAIAQQYIEPYLVDELKFDLRVYALVVSIDPLRIYLHREGLARFCTEKYEKPRDGNLELSFAHLTNYALNKNNPNFQQPTDKKGQDKSCHKRSMQSVIKQIEEELQEKNKTNEIDLMKGIEEIIRLTVISVQPYISSCYKTAIHVDDDKSRCFEILGFDIMIDDEGKPWLLEVNWSPSFADESPFDVSLKKSVIKGALKIVNVPSNFKKCIAARRKAIASRKPTSPLWNMNEELEIAKKTNYKLIYPLPPENERYIDTEMALFESKNAYQHSNNGNNMRVENRKIKSYNSFNINENQEPSKSCASARGNYHPLCQKQAKIIPPIARPNAQIAPRQNHSMNIKNSKSLSQPFFQIQTITDNENSVYNSTDLNSDTFYQRRIKSPRRVNYPSAKDQTNDIQFTTNFQNHSTNTNNNQHPTVNTNDYSNAKEEGRSNVEIHQKVFCFPESLPKLVTDK